jgi:hypothetical protein
MTYLVYRNEHLTPHRRMILARSIAASLLGAAVPLPYIEDWLPSVVRRGMIKRLADARGVDIDEAGVRAIADGVVPPPGWRTVIRAAPFSRMIRRAVRTALITLNVYARADEASRTFAIATLFDHYCARIHVGIGLDAAAGRNVRARIDRAREAVPRALGADLFRRAFSAAGGMAARLVRKRDPNEAEEIVEEALVAADGDAGGNFIARATRALDRQLAAVGRTYVERLVDAFDADETGPA